MRPTQANRTDGDVSSGLGSVPALLPGSITPSLRLAGAHPPPPKPHVALLVFQDDNLNVRVDMGIANTSSAPYPDWQTVALCE